MKLKRMKGRVTKLLCGALLLSVGAFSLAGCDLLSVSSALSLSSADTSSSIEPTYSESTLLKDIYSDYFRIGGTVSSYNMTKFEGLQENYNSITAEWQMKWGTLEPSEGTYAYDNADSIVSWAKENGKQVRGHCLLWYKSLPTWLSEKANTKEKALRYIDKHVKETMSHFSDNVYCWDVVNEALHNSVSQEQLDGGDIYRTGKEVSGSGTVDWYSLCGEDFIKQAFRSADEARKEYGLEDVELYYNDYSLNNPAKRSACVQLVKMLQESGIAIDGVGMQAHYRLPNYTADKETFMQNFEDSVKAFTELGVNVQITELDISIYESSTSVPASDGLTAEDEYEQAEMYGKIFEICRKYSTPWKTGAGVVNCVTTWGIADDSSSLNSSSRDDYPLLFDRSHEPKRAYYEVSTF